MTTTVDAAAGVDADLARLVDTLGGISDGDLHRASFGGGWTVAQVVSHISVSTLVWLGVDEPPPRPMAGRLAATRRTLATCLPSMAPELLTRTVEIPDLGTMTIEEWTPLIMGHITSHVEQAHDILRNRGVL